MKTLSKEAEAHLLDAVREVSSLTDEGSDPNTAIVKVAQQYNLKEGFIRLVAQAYNVGRTAHQREGGSDILDKLASFELADADVIFSRLYPEKVDSPASVKTARDVSNVYNRPPQPLPFRLREATKKLASRTVKMASAPVPYARDPGMDMARAYKKALDLRRVVEEARFQAVTARDDYLGTLSKLGEYFKQGSGYRVSFQEADSIVPLLFGDVGKLAMDYVHTRNGGREKRAEGPAAKCTRPVDRTQVPYSLVDNVIKAGESLLERQQEHLDIEKSAQVEERALLLPFVAGREPAKEEPFSILSEKCGNILSGAIGGTISKSWGKPTAELVSDYELELSDPGHQQELNRISAKAMVNDFIANDDIISGYNPEEVLGSYNEVVQLSPHSAAQPALMRSLLRRRLQQGGSSEFEAKELADIEKTLTETVRPQQHGVLNVSPALAR